MCVYNIIFQIVWGFDDIHVYVSTIVLWKHIIIIILRRIEKV